jgi:hypothetical protein
VIYKYYRMLLKATIQIGLTVLIMTLRHGTASVLVGYLKIIIMYNKTILLDLYIFKIDFWYLLLSLVFVALDIT